MAGLYVPLDVDYANDPKIIRAGAMAELLYVRALAMAKRLMEDGLIDTAHLAALSIGIPGKPAKYADALVREGLWAETGTGWRITAWAKRNASRAEIRAASELAKEAGIRGNHERWHVGPNGRPSPQCPLCIGERSQTPSGTRIGGESGKCRDAIAKSESESKEPSSKVSSSGTVPEATPPDDDDRIQPAVTAIVDRSIARQVAAGKTLVSPTKYRAACLEQAKLELRPGVEMLAEENPRWSVEQLVNAMVWPLRGTPPGSDPLSQARTAGANYATADDEIACSYADRLTPEQAAAFHEARDQARAS